MNSSVSLADKPKSHGDRHRMSLRLSGMITTDRLSSIGEQCREVPAAVIQNYDIHVL